jgi:hypothetical protein
MNDPYADPYPDPDPSPVPVQSLQKRVSFPGITQAARDLNVSRIHLWNVLVGRRISHRLSRRWKAWLEAHPEFARLQKN